MNNNLKANAGKFHLFLIPNEDQMITVKNYVIKSSGVTELLGVTTDSNLNFKEHILFLCKKANHKLHALSLLSKYMTLNKHHIFMNFFIISRFDYCPLIWIIHRSTTEVSIIKLTIYTRDPNVQYTMTTVPVLNIFLIKINQ